MHVRQAFFDLLDILEKDDFRDTDAILARMQTHYGIRHQCYVNMSSSGGKQNVLDVVHSFPEEFVNVYKRKLYAVDPVMQAALIGIKPVDWQERHRNEPAARKTFAVAADYGIGDTGMSIPLLSRGNEAALFSIYVEIRPEEWPRYRKEVIGELQVLATYLHSARRQGSQDAITADLTARESEVLTWTAAGKSYWEISMILGISDRTVRFFMTNARHKLGAVTNSQAVALAVSQGIIPH
ncbi:helix-turn-helix transcriptional regulator [Hoeflea poritis]|uniref:LuxR family transcriptional regulator n=1 Tax=Hoeflea poritis TaxID=2993659 RepID=A0ABT4VUH6_9HYPH|nr:LuxR family transcriptional regulator [Hoeflea poritis]MDA4848274.1 LuxR family transcriptional regulator [Hoeflea poritis]